MSKTEVTKDIRYVGVDDREIGLFESQYIVPNGVSYNSYLIMDEKIALMDTVDARKTGEWLLRVKEELAGSAPDYLVISHLEPDHAGSIAAVISEYPNIKLVGNAKTFSMLPQFFKLDTEDKKVVVAEVLFSADGFGKFGALDVDEDWACEARRYYYNIVGKYGAMVQALLKKAAALDIQIICPLHGPVLKENLSYYIEKYDTWSSYRPEDKGVLVAFAAMLRENGAAKVVTADLAREDMAEVIKDAFRYDRTVLFCATYDGGLFPCMEDFLHHLKAKAFQKRTVALVENGSWAPMAAKGMRKLLEEMKDIRILEPVVTIRSTMDERVEKELQELAKAVGSAE